MARSEQLAGLLTEIVGTDAAPGQPPSESLAFEVEVATGRRLGSAALRTFADPSPITCPDCSGVLSEMRGERPLRFRCQIGHAYTAEIAAANTEEVDAAVRIAMRVMEERVTLVDRMAQDARATAARPWRSSTRRARWNTGATRRCCATPRCCQPGCGAPRRTRRPSPPRPPAGGIRP